MMCGDYVVEGYQVCPICQKRYSEPPALSRNHPGTSICPDCGTDEALEAARPMIGGNLNDTEWAELKAEIIEKTHRRQ